jgi:hypothetical protein
MAFEGEAVSPIDRIAHPKVGGITGTVGWIQFARHSAGRKWRHSYPCEFLDRFGKAWRTSDFWLKPRPGRPIA